MAATKPSLGTPKTTKDWMPEEWPDEASSGDGCFRLKLDRYPLEEVVAPEDLQVEVVKDATRDVLLLSGGDSNAVPHGVTGGCSVRVPESFEAAVSGLRVRVKVMARAAGGLGDAELSLAYSTNDVGNSGWQSRSVGQTFETVSFEWDVPPMINGNGDYVGILPGQAGAIEIAGIAVFAIARE